MRVPLIVGLLLSPLIPSASVAMLMASLSPFSTLAFTDFMLILLVAEFVSVVLAGPAYVVLRKRTQIKLRHCLIAGALLGAIAGILGIAVGVPSAAIFWLLVIRGSAPGASEGSNA